MTISEFKKMVQELPESDQELELEFHYKDRDGFVCTSWRKDFRIDLDSAGKVVLHNM